MFIQGPGEYHLNGWGREDCKFYTESETIKCTIRYKGKVLCSKNVKIGGGGSRKIPQRNTSSNESGWTRFKNKIEDIGYWFDERKDDPESVTSIITLIIFILYVIAIIVYWVNEGFWAALIFGVIGFFVMGLILACINIVAKIILYILRFVFYNVWTFLIVAIIGLADIISVFGHNLLSDIGDKFEDKIEIVEPQTMKYICTAKSGMKVRKAPSTSAEQVGSISYNQVVDVYEVEGDFARIKYANAYGNEAWTSRKYLQLDEEAFFAENEQRKGVKSLVAVQYEVIKKGKGDKPNINDKVRCYYTISTVEGDVIDSNKGGEPTKFGLEDVITGWTEALLYMKEGAKWKVYIPSKEAYGSEGRGVIPPNTPLVCEIELVEIINSKDAKFADFTVTQEDGSKVSLSDYVGNGRYVLVDFWASWCAPCRKSIPHLINFYRGHSKSLDMLGVASWDKPEDSRQIIEQYQVPYPQILNAQQSHTQLYNIEKIPHLILFAPDGEVLLQGYPNDDFFAQVKSIIYK